MLFFRITYTCPIGYVIENPYGIYNEQPNPIPKEQVKSSFFFSNFREFLGPTGFYRGSLNTNIIAVDF